MPSKDTLYLIMACIFLIGGVLILILTWRDSLRNIKEFFDPLKRAKFQFRLKHLLIATVAVAILVKIAVVIQLNLLDAALAMVLGVGGLAGCLVWVFLEEAFGNTKIKRDEEATIEPPPPGSEGGIKTPKLRLRLSEDDKTSVRFKR